MQTERLIPEGLTSAQAAALLKRHGYNELPGQEGRSPLAIAKGVLGEPMFGLLLAAAALYLVLGDFAEAVVLSLFATLSVSIAVVQEFRSEKILQALRDLSSPRALVLRDGVKKRIAGREVVPGDILILAEGDRVPADALLLSDDQIVTDESLLTGESVPVRKSFSAGGEAAAVHAGTLVVQGGGRLRVSATGTQSAIGKIGKALAGIRMEPPRLQVQTRRIVRVFALLALTVSGLAVLTQGMMRGEWTEALLQGIAVGMSLLPEEFPLVLSVFMVMGAWRISQAGVLTRRAAAIETMGSATVLCTDKTGTLTQNRMTIVYLQSQSTTWETGGAELHEELQELAEAGALSCKADTHDPMDLAFLSLARPSAELPVRHYGIQTDCLMMAQAYGTNGDYRVYAKGAPEAVAAACDFSEAETEKLHADVRTLAEKGIRVLAVAEARFAGVALPDRADGFDYRFLGLAGFADPLRDAVPAAVAECRAAGIRVVMMTGDYPATARAIAAAAGIDGGSVLSGDEVAAMADDALRRAVGTVSVFARIMPEQKLRIVSALKSNGEIVAMTGDGVNDAPALKAAHIGVAMGGRGTDVAREASSLVLLEDNFDSLVRTVALGRRIYDNLRKAMTYIVAVHVPIAGLALWPLMMPGMPLILTPLLIALMEMVIDPVCSVVLEAEEAEGDVMRRPPRDPQAPLLSTGVIAWGALQGVAALAVVSLGVVFAQGQAMPENDTRALVFVLMLFCNLALILVNRSFSRSLRAAFRRRNPLLGWGFLSVTLLFCAFLLIPPAADLFGFGAFHAEDLAVSAGGGIALLLLLEALKPLLGDRLRK